MLKFQNLIQDESGVTAIEYGLIAGLISVVIISSVKAVGTDLKVVFDKIASALESALLGPTS